MLVTGFEKKGSKVLIRFEDGSDIILNYEVFLKNGLKINNDLSDSRLAFLFEENLKHQIKQSAFSLLSRRLHSSSELKTKLKQKYRQYDLIEEVVNDLIDSKYLDDEKFAAEFIEEKGRSKLWGSKKIKAELRRRGINSPDDEFIGEHLAANSENLIKAAEKKLKLLQIRNLPEDKLKQKLVAYLLGKGFGYDEINSLIKKLL
jgi:regulatory protein